jgi:amidase
VSDLHELTALEMAAAVRRREVSPVDLVRHALDRAADQGVRVGAFVTLTPEAALQRARELEALPPDLLPALAGVPTAEKDLFATAGVRTRSGSAALLDHVPSYDDHSVVLLRRAGLVSIGKTSTPELGLPGYTEPDPRVGPTAVTPWDLTRIAGGSSGGAAAAVAAGVVPVASASDGGGDADGAACCATVGFKPSRGLVSNGPRANDWSGLSTRGVESRTVADTAALLDVLKVPFDGDLYSSPAQGHSFAEAAGRDPGRLRVGVITDNILDAPLAPEVRAATMATAALLEGLGHEVSCDVAMLPVAGLYESFLTVWCVSAAQHELTPGQEEQLRPLTRALRSRGRELSAVQLATALSGLNAATTAALAATQAYDVLLMPTLAQLPPVVGSLRDDEQPWNDMLAQGMFTPYTSQLNVTGQPAVSLPLQWTPDGFPVGSMLVGRPHADALLISLCAQLELAQPWHDRRPSLW